MNNVKTQSSQKRRKVLGKYRGLAILIIILVVAVLALFALNLFLSNSIERNAKVVALTDRQSSLINQVSKDLFLIESRFNQRLPLSDEKQVLKGIVKQFDTMLDALQEGGDIEVSETAVHVPKLVGGQSNILLFEANTLWEWYKQSIDPVLKDDVANSESAILNAREISEKYTQRLSYMVENIASLIRERSVKNIYYMRVAQYIGIALVLLIFIWTAFVTMRNLLGVDAALDVARGQMKNILNTVDSGLFLISDKGVIGDQYSNEMENIFATSEISGKPFSDFMRGMVSESDLSMTRDFLGLIFDRRKKQKLLGDLNPLQQVTVQVPGEEQEGVKYLKFKFQRVENDRGDVDSALGNVLDITKQVLLEQKLEASESKNSQQIEMLSTLANTDFASLNLFINNCTQVYASINDILREESQSKGRSDYIEKANLIFALIHGVKGEAGALDIDWIMEECSTFEENVKLLRNKVQLKGQDFLSLTVSLDQLISYNEMLESLLSFFRKTEITDKNDETNNSGLRRNWDNLYRLSESVSERQGKNVELILCGLNDYELTNESAALLTTLATQLVRNAIAHGIEIEKDRLKFGKKVIGNIWLILSRNSNGEFSLKCIDNGAGIDVLAVNEKAIEHGIITKDQAASLGEKETFNMLFHPSFSTAEGVDVDRGQGVGLFSVKQKVKEFGGKIFISSVKGKGVNITITLPRLSNQERG